MQNLRSAMNKYDIIIVSIIYSFAKYMLVYRIVQS